MKAKTGVGRSGIHGKGLFAKQPITKGRRIGIMEGIKTRKEGIHVLWMYELKRPAGLWVKNAMRFINHSDEPNAVLNGTEIHAIKHIHRGEEIFFNYNPKSPRDSN